MGFRQSWGEPTGCTARIQVHLRRVPYSRTANRISHTATAPHQHLHLVAAHRTCTVVGAPTSLVS